MCFMYSGVSSNLVPINFDDLLHTYFYEIIMYSLFVIIDCMIGNDKKCNVAICVHNCIRISTIQQMSNSCWENVNFCFPEIVCSYRCRGSKLTRLYFTFIYMCKSFKIIEE